MKRSGVFGWRARQRLRRAGISQATLEPFLAPIFPASLKPQVLLAGLRLLVARYDLVIGYQ
jgi:hypothetical protein